MISDRSILRIGDGPLSIHRVVTDKYYDGPERGVAIFTNGCKFSFESIGESASRLYRCFALSAVDDIASKFDEIYLAFDEDRDAGYVKFINTESEDSEIYYDAISRTCDFKFIAVGSPGLDCLEIASLNQEEILSIKAQKSWVETFRVSHSLLKSRQSISS